jgi:hypothetical protein
MGDREHVVSVRLTGEESAYLDQLCQIRDEDRSTVLRDLIASTHLLSVRPYEFVGGVGPVKPQPVVDITPDPMLAACVCDLIETTADPEYPSYVRGKSNGCQRHLSERDQRDAAARRKARE